MTTESEFNRFFAKALARTEKNPAEVSEVLRDISERLGLKHSRNQFQDYIDPFTTMAYYNRQFKEDKDGRARELIFEFDIECDVPTEHSHIPLPNNMNMTFVYGDVEEHDAVVDKVWNCFRTIVRYTEGDATEDEFVDAFDYCATVKGMVAKPHGMLTMALSWIDSERFLSLDGYNRKFLEQNGVPYREIKEADGRGYLIIVEKAREILKSAGLESFDELSGSAYVVREGTPYELDYDPGFTVDQWEALIEDVDLFTPKALRVVACFLDYGGGATCKELSERYGSTPGFYNGVSNGLAQRIAKQTGCPLPASENGTVQYWPVLFTGSYTNGTGRSGSFIWTLRPELKEALEHKDLSNVNLYAEDEDDEDEVSGNHLWFNARQSVWDLSALDTGDVFEVNGFKESGRPRSFARNFTVASEGDVVIGYIPQPVKAIVSIIKVVEPFDGNVLKMEVVEKLDNPVGYDLWANDAFLTGSEPLKNNLRGTLFKLNDDEFNRIMEIIRETNPEEPEEEDPLEPYTREDFLSQVYMTPKKYDDIVARVRRNRNVILKGAPGVGKTYAAKKLAYSMMGEIDESRVEFVQFHQSYTYEDFILGYKPSGDGFELREGVFHRFCSKAHRNPEKEFFFIIDEINRGNISRIFGELMMAIECDHRGEEVTLAYGQSRFSVPKNLYIIGMMNTADRSLAMIDYALRRRFGFFDIEPGFESEGFRRFMDDHDGRKFRNLVSTVMDINRAISNDDSLGKGFCIGHSYFCDYDGDEAMLEDIVEHDLIPLLEEYYYDDRRRFEQWADDLRGALHD